MREDRLKEEAISDAALLLALYARVQERSPTGTAGDRLKLMKLSYLAANRLFEERAKGLNCTFYRWTFGPLSNHVYRTWEMLCRAGLLEEDEEFTVTPEGIDLARAFVDDVLASEPNVHFLRMIEAVADEWGNKLRGEILDSVYEMDVVPIDSAGPMKVRDVPLTGHLIEALDPHEAKSVLDVPESWLETLALQLDAESMASIERGEVAAQASRLIDGDELWAEFA